MNITSRIVTPPQKVTYVDGQILLGTSGAALYRIENKADGILAKTAEAKIESTLSGLLVKKAEASVVITLEIADAPADMPNADQGYRLTIKPDGISLCGYGQRGLLYAAVTLCQMLKLEDGAVTLPCLEMIDWPNLEKRGHFMESRYGTNLMTLDDWKAAIDDLVEKKQNIMTVSLYGCWGMQYDGEVCEYVYFSLDKYPKLKTSVITKYYSPKQGKWIDKVEDTPIAAQDLFGEMCAYGAQHGVEVVPLINSYGHNTIIPRMYPEVSAKRVDGSACGNGFCTSNPKTYELLFDIYDAIIDRYLIPNGITSFDIGMDEIDDQSGTIGVNPDDPFAALPAFCECEKCKDIPSYTKFVDHAIKLIKHLKEKGMKTVYIYNDMFFRKFDPKKDFYLVPVLDSQRAETGDTSIVSLSDNYLPLFRGELVKNDVLDVTVMNWWKYTDVFDRMTFLRDDIATSGMPSVVKPMNGYYHWNVLRPAVKNSYYLADFANNIEDCRGFISYSSWDNAFDRTNSAQASYCWNFKAAESPDKATRDYCKRLFHPQWEKAYQGFKLLDACNREGNEVYEDGSRVLDSRTLTERTLAYYLFSYISKGKPYPRVFPGEPLSTILEKRGEYEALIITVSAMAKQASEIFHTLADTPDCDRYYASRYAWEADNFSVLCDDWLALLRIYDITQGKLCSCAPKRIEALARERFDARIKLMTECEEIKEAYLHSSHMRNQSVFLQLFTDIIAYAKRTPAEEFALNLLDLSNVSSEQYKNLR